MDSAKTIARSEPQSFRDWTRGSIFRNLLALSWPMAVMESMWVVSQIVDLIWVGRLGSQSMAGVGLANMILGMVMAVDMGMVVGVRAIISRYVGAGDIASANRVAGQSILFGAAWGVLVTAIGLLLARPLLALFGADANVVAEGAAYMQVMFAGWAGLEILVFGLYSVQASGDTMTPMAVEVCIRILHIALCPFLVMGYWVFPHLGTAGAALSNVIAQVLGAIIVCAVLFRARGRLKPSLGDLRFAPRVMWSMLKIGVPALLMNIQSSLGMILLAGLVVPFGTVAVASHTLASRVEMFLYVPGMGLGAGAGVLVGQNLGAARPDRARKGAWLALAIVQAFMIICTIAILLWAERVIGFFSTDPALVKTGSDFLRIAAAGYLVMAFNSVFQNSIAGAGDTVPNMVIAIASVWVLQLPLAFLLSRVFGFGIYGVRWAMAVCAIASAVAYTAYFGGGRWARKRV
jgi:putative MATE family efflux protein